jgi:hypothetical protein
MTNLLQQAINCDDGDRAARIIQNALRIENDDVANYCFPKTWPTHREQRALIIGDCLQTEARYLAWRTVIYLSEITALAVYPMTLNMTLANAPAGSEIILLELVALFLTVASMRLFLSAIQKLTPDDFEDRQFFWIVVLVMIPFVMLVYFGLAIIICNEITARSGRPMTLPLELSLRKVVPATVTYIGLAAWIWLRWHKLVTHQRIRWSALDSGEYREAAGGATQNLIEVASPKRYLVPLPAVVAATSVVCADCSDATEDTLAEGVDSAQQV